MARGFGKMGLNPHKAGKHLLIFMDLFRLPLRERLLFWMSLTFFERTAKVLGNKLSPRARC